MEVWGKTDQENGPKAEKDNTEIAAGLGRRTIEEIYKSGIKLAALRFQAGGRHQKSHGLPSGASRRKETVCMHLTVHTLKSQLLHCPSLDDRNFYRKQDIVGHLWQSISHLSVVHHRTYLEKALTHLPDGHRMASLAEHFPLA